MLEWASSVGLIKRQMSGEIQRIADVKILQLNSMYEHTVVLPDKIFSVKSHFQTVFQQPMKFLSWLFF